MQTATATAAATAESALVNAIDTAAQALDAVGRQPVRDALDRLAASASAAQQRLTSAQQEAVSILGAALAGFTAFAQQITAPVPVEAPAADEEVAAVEPTAPAEAPTLPQDVSAPQEAREVDEAPPAAPAATQETGEAVSAPTVPAPAEPEGAGETMARVLLSRERREEEVVATAANAPAAVEAPPVLQPAEEVPAPAEGEATPPAKPTGKARKPRKR